MKKLFSSPEMRFYEHLLSQIIKSFLSDLKLLIFLTSSLILIIPPENRVCKFVQFEDVHLFFYFWIFRFNKTRNIVLKITKNSNLYFENVFF